MCRLIQLERKSVLEVDQRPHRTAQRSAKDERLGMNYQNNLRIWLPVLALAGWIPAGRGVAQVPRPLERLGRLYGVYWGDGYHACDCSGVRPLADLPPSSARATAVSRQLPIGPAHRRGATFYDRFDASHRSNCSSAACDSGQCDAGGWTTDSHDVGQFGADQPSGIYLSPSAQMTDSQFPESAEMVDLPSFAGPPEAEFVPPAPKLTAPQSTEPKRIPTKPMVTTGSAGNSAAEQEPDDRNREASGDRRPVKQDQPSAAIENQLPPSTDVLLSSQPAWILPLASIDQTPQRPTTAEAQPGPVARASQTPLAINPLHTSPEPEAADKTAQQDTQAAKISPTSIDEPTWLGGPEQPLAATKPAELARQPRRLGAATIVDSSRQTSIAPMSRPSRLGASTETVISARPGRLGNQSLSGSLPGSANPFENRPVVDMAKRVSDSEAGFVRQPSQLK